MGYAAPAAFLLALCGGTFSTLTVKAVYEVEVVGLGGELSKFEKPIFSTFVMFLAMCFAIPAHLFLERCTKKRADVDADFDQKSGAATVDEAAGSPGSNIYLALIIPALFDLAGTIFAKFGLMYCSMSIYQLIRCAVMIFCAVLKHTVLKHRLKSFQWFGVFTMTLAMGIVSSSSFLDNSANSSSNADPRIGILCLLASCLIQSCQYVYEEKMMSGAEGAAPLLVVGMEGVWGVVIMVSVVFPWAYCIPGSDSGSFENTHDTLVKLSNSSTVCYLLLAFFVTVAAYNVCAIYVTYLLSSLWHAILDNFRPMTVWIASLGIYYCFNHSDIGEPWNEYSWIQLGGMIILFVGTAIYNGSLRLPCFRSQYPLDKDCALVMDDSEMHGGGDLDVYFTPKLGARMLSGSSTTSTASIFGTPGLMRSPLLVQSTAGQKKARLAGLGLSKTPPASFTFATMA